MSRPSVSVPNMCSDEGPVRIEFVSIADGLYLAIKGANIANRSMITDEYER
jgi:hypothetical protein